MTDVEFEPWPGNRADAAHSGRVVVVLPGANYGVQAPVLHFPAAMLAEFGWFVLGVRWSLDDDAREAPFEFVGDVAERALVSAPAHAERMIVAKSFGTYALPWAVANAVPGAWLTPVLTNETVRAAARLAGPEHILIGGTADELWVPAGLTTSGAQVVGIEDADHSLRVAGDWRASIRSHEIAGGHIERWATALASSW